MARAIDTTAIDKFITKYDAQLAQEKQTIWHCAYLESDIYEFALTNHILKPDQQEQKIDVLKNIILVGLKGFENFLSADGNSTVEFKTIDTNIIINGKKLQIVDPGIINKIFIDERIEIANRIRQINTVAGDDLKN